METRETSRLGRIMNSLVRILFNPQGIKKLFWVFSGIVVVLFIAPLILLLSFSDYENFLILFVILISLLVLFIIVYKKTILAQQEFIAFTTAYKGLTPDQKKPYRRYVYIQMILSFLFATLFVSLLLIPERLDNLRTPIAVSMGTLVPASWILRYFMKRWEKRITAELRSDN